MYAIVRPGPHICAEWDNGGLPAWLFRDPEVGVRRFELRYLAAVREYLAQVLRVVVPYQVDRGGPVLLVQVENEYGAFGSDPRYLKALAEYTREAGITVPLTTVDQPVPEMLAAGGLDGLHRTASFGSGAESRLAILLYVPGPVVRAGANELMVLELDVLLDPVARFVPRPLLGHTEA